MDYLTGAANLNETGEEFLAMLNGYGISNASLANFTELMTNMTMASFTTTVDPNSSDNDGVYPSGYTITTIVIAAVVVTILMIIIVVGNLLVIIAIMTEKSLKNIQNWFIASLAVADFSLGLIIMPFSLANELMGYWVFGDWWCDIHSAADVLLCTSSIMNLCLISLDRYWSITQAVEYLRVSIIVTHSQSLLYFSFFLRQHQSSERWKEIKIEKNAVVVCSRLNEIMSAEKNNV